MKKIYKIVVFLLSLAQISQSQTDHSFHLLNTRPQSDITLLVAQGLPQPTGQERLLRGKYCSYSGSSGVYTGSYSHANWAQFDGQGEFIYGSSTYSSGGAGTYYSGDTNPHNRGFYRVKEQIIYLIFSDGSIETARVYNRRADGTISEVMYENTLYAPALCE